MNDKVMVKKRRWQISKKYP